MSPIFSTGTGGFTAGAGVFAAGGGGTTATFFFFAQPGVRAATAISAAAAANRFVRRACIFPLSRRSPLTREQISAAMFCDVLGKHVRVRCPPSLHFSLDFVSSSPYI